MVQPILGRWMNFAFFGSDMQMKFLVMQCGGVKVCTLSLRREICVVLCGCDEGFYLVWKFGNLDLLL